MPSLKKVQRLREIANMSISKQIARFCIETEELTTDEGSLAIMRGLRSEKALSLLLMDLPGVLVDSLIYSSINILLEDEDRRQELLVVDGRGPIQTHVPGLHIALRLLPQKTSSNLDLSPVFTKVILMNKCKVSLNMICFKQKDQREWSPVLLGADVQPPEDGDPDQAGAPQQGV